MGVLRVFYHTMYAVETKSNGHEALRELRGRQEDGQQFDLVLSDVHMPDMDGFKLLEQIGLELDLPVISELLSSICCRIPSVWISTVTGFLICSDVQ